MKDEVVIGIKTEYTRVNWSVSPAVYGLRIFIDLEVPAGRTVKLNDTLITVIAVSTHDRSTGNLIPRNGGGLRQINETMVGESIVRERPFPLGGTFFTVHKTYLLEAQIPFSKSEVIRVNLPAFTINNQDYGLPEITFADDTYFGIAPINC